MSTLLRLPIPPENFAAFRFGRAELQVASERLLIDGKEVPLAPMAYRFLLCLCLARGGLLSRNEVFDTLWPGGGSGSDEALAQIVLKVRQALGPEGRAVITVRARGFRLDLPVEPVSLARLESVRLSAPLAHAAMAETDDVPAPSLSKIPADSSFPQTRTPVRRRLSTGGWVGIAIAVVALLIAATWWLRVPTSNLDGYRLHADSFGPISSQGIENVKLGLLRDDEGDRASAEQLLRAMIASEPRSGLPAFFLLLWISGDEQELQQWRKQLRDRMPAQSNAYTQLVARWVSLEQTVGGGAELEVLNGALKLEPSAWRLHLARAHVLVRGLRFDAALADLRQVPLADLAPRHALYVMSDRASLGDADAIERALPALALRAPAIADYVRGRIALARGRWQDAQIALEAAARLADDQALIGSMSQSPLLAATAAAAQQNWDSVERNAIEARRTGNEHNMAALANDAETLIAYAQVRRSEKAAANASWERAKAGARAMHNGEAEARLWLQRARLDPVWALAQVPPEFGSDDIPVFIPALVAARTAWLSCADDASKAALIIADGHDVQASYFSDEADLLRHDLGLPRRADRRAPLLPYPSFGRWITYWESDRPAGARPCDGLHSTSSTGRH